MQQDQSGNKRSIGQMEQCEALRNKLRAAAARNAEREQSIEVLKQELADSKVKAAKKVQNQLKNGENR